MIEKTKKILKSPFVRVKNDITFFSSKDKISKEFNQTKNNFENFESSVLKKQKHATYQEALISLKLTKKDEINSANLHRNMKATSIVMAIITAILCLFLSTSKIHTLSFAMIVFICFLTYLKHSIKLKQIQEQRLLTLKDYLKLVFINK